LGFENKLPRASARGLKSFGIMALAKYFHFIGLKPVYSLSKLNHDLAEGIPLGKGRGNVFVTD